MNFYIKKIKLWFSTHSQPIEYEFKKNKVNVVTGDSSTGKSSILRVIDYCLLSKESTIVEDVINENVAWYGLALHLNGHDYVVARKAPTNGRIGHDFYWADNTDEFPGDDYPRPTQGVSRVEIIDFINREFGVPQIKLEENKQSLEPSFREMMLMSYLTEDIIATSSTYFDTQFNTETVLDPFVLRLFRLGLGADEKREQELTTRKTALEKKIKDEEGHKTTDINNKEKYNKELSEILTKARKLGLIEGDNNPIEILIQQLNAKIDEFDRMKRSHAKLRELDGLRLRLRQINQELIGYNSLRREYRRASEYSEKVEDSLRPLEYLERNLSSSLLGEEAMLLYRSLEGAFETAKGNKLIADELPADFEENFRKLKAEEHEIKVKIEEYGQAANSMFDPNALYEYMKLSERVKALKQNPEKFIGDLELKKLKDELTNVSRELDIVTRENKVRATKYLEDVQSYYELQTGMSVSYRGCQVDFDEARKMLILKKEGEYFPIKNVGSKSNYMFMHLCFYLGMHQYLCEQTSSFVPNFLFIDQPSIPYYGNNRRGGQTPGDLTVQKKDDETKLKEAFKLINSFMSQNVGEELDFQIILIEHADPEYWKNLPFFETRYVFTVEKNYGLIPEYVAPLS